MPGARNPKDDALATIRDVARAAGVSIATVSHVVNATRKVAPETAQRVREAMQDLDYRPTALARRLRRGESSTVGLLISDIANPFFPEIVASFEQAAHEADLEVLVGNTGYDPERCQRAVEAMLDARVQAVAVLASELEPERFEELERRGVRLVFLDRGLEGGSPVLRVDYGAGLGLAVDHVHELGHRHVAFVGGPERLFSARERLKGFQEAVARHGSGTELLDHVVLPGDFQVEGGRRAARSLLAMDPRPTAVICGNDLMALALLSELSTSGITVPEEMSVVGFDGIAFGAIAAPPLTTVDLGPAGISFLAFEMLQELVEGGTRLSDRFLVPELLVRRSSAEPQTRVSGGTFEAAKTEGRP